MKTYRYANPSNSVVHVIDEDGKSRQSMMADQVPNGESIEPYSPSAEELAAQAQETADATERADARAVAALTYLANHTNAEIRTFLDGNINVAAVTDLASAKACLNRIENRLEDLAIGLAVLVRRELR